jgi:hypothetical protein
VELTGVLSERREQVLQNKTCMSGHLATVLTPEDKNTAFRATAGLLEKTNPLWQPAKENKGVTFRRQSIFGRTRFRLCQTKPTVEMRSAGTVAAPTFIVAVQE